MENNSAIDEISALDFPTYAERYLVIRDKRDTLQPFRLKRAQRHFLENMTGRDIIVKSRRIGFSTLIQAYIQYQTLVNATRWAVLAHKFDVGTHVFRTMQNTFYTNLPDALQLKRTTANAAITVFANGGEISIGTAGSKDGGRGATFGGGFHGSEVAFWKNGDQIMNGILEAVSDLGQVFLESTANGAQGTFYETVQGALNGENDFTVHFYAWWWDEDCWDNLALGETLTYTDDEQSLVDRHGLQPEQIKWRRRKMRQPGIIFEQEYPEDIATAFVTSGNAVFTLSHANTLDTAPDPSPDMRCIAGIDWGQQHDSTALSIIDAETNQEVALHRWSKQSWSSIRGDIVDVLRHWNVRKIIAEKNAMGSSQIEELLYDLSDAGHSATMQPYTMTNKKKDALVKMLQGGLAEDGLQLLPDAVGKSELLAFQATQSASGLWTYSAPSGGHDDTVIARMLAWYGCQNLLRI